MQVTTKTNTEYADLSLALKFSAFIKKAVHQIS